MIKDTIVDGFNNAPHRSLYHAIGLTKEEQSRPLIGIVSSYNEIVPGHMNLDKIADALTWVVDQMIELAGRSDGTFKKIVGGAAGVGNAIINFLVTPFRIAIEAGKGVVNVLKDIFSGNWKQAGQTARDALSVISGAIDKGFAFKQNFEAGQAAVDGFVAGLSSRKKKAKLPFRKPMSASSCLPRAS